MIQRIAILIAVITILITSAIAPSINIYAEPGYSIELYEGDDLSPSDNVIPRGSLIRAKSVTDNPTVGSYRYIWHHTESGATIDTGLTHIMIRGSIHLVIGL